MTGSYSATLTSIERESLRAQRRATPHPSSAISGPGQVGDDPVRWFCQRCRVGWNAGVHPFVEDREVMEEGEDLPPWFNG